MSTKKPEPTHELILLSGVEGMSVYLNNYRIAGPKPWGGGKAIRTWRIEGDHVRWALKLGIPTKTKAKRKGKVAK